METGSIWLKCGPIRTSTAAVALVADGVLTVRCRRSESYRHRWAVDPVRGERRSLLGFGLDRVAEPTRSERRRVTTDRAAAAFVDRYRAGMTRCGCRAGCGRSHAQARGGIIGCPATAG